MDYQTYRKKYFDNPAPEPRFRFSRASGTTLYYQDYEEALAFFEEVLGPPAYIEGESTHGWRIGSTWLTLLRGKKGNPRNVEAPFFMETPEEVDRLYEAFLAAGAKGEAPSDELMYEPVRMCVLTDPLGVSLLVACPLSE